MGQAPAGESYNVDCIGLPLIAGASDFGEVTPAPSRFTTASSKQSRTGDIIMCIRATIGDLNWSDDVYCLGRGVAGIRVDQSVAEPRYIWWALDQNKKELSARGRGATFKQVKRADIATLRIPLPPLDEQRRIAAILDQADALRRKREKIVKRLIDLRVTMLDRALTGAPSTREATLGDLVVEFRYGTSEKSGPSGSPVLRIPNVVSDNISLIDLKYVKLNEAEKSRLTLRTDDLLFVRTNGNRDYVARCALVKASLGSDLELSPRDLVFASYLIRARLKPEIVNPVFLQAYLSSPAGRIAVLRRAKTSAGQFNINIEGLSALPITMPPMDTQRAFADFSVVIDQLLNLQQQGQVSFDTIFGSLQNRAFNGALTAKLAERELDEFG